MVTNTNQLNNDAVLYVFNDGTVICRPASDTVKEATAFFTTSTKGQAVSLIVSICEYQAQENPINKNEHWYRFPNYDGDIDQIKAKFEQVSMNLKQPSQSASNDCIEVELG